MKKYCSLQGHSELEIWYFSSRIARQMSPFTA